MYHGPWSDASELWTPELRAEANHEDKNDGKFFMPIEGWVENLAYSTFSYDVEDQHHAHFLVLDDTYDNPDESEMCGSYYFACTKHTFTVFSRVAQTVRVSAHTWQDGFYLGDCLWDAPIDHTMYIPKTGDAYTWSYGAQHTYRPIRLQAGEKLTVELYMNFGYDVGLGKDFGLTAWSDLAPVRLVHMGGLISDRWDNFDLDKSIEIPTNFTPYAPRSEGTEDEIDPNTGSADTNKDDSESEPTKTNEEEANTAVEPIGLTDEELADALNEWAPTQELADSAIWSCDYQLYADYPFGDEYMVVWANHDCSRHDLYLTLLMSLETAESYVWHTGADFSERSGCYESSEATDWSGAVYACEFYLPAGGDNFAILFRGDQLVEYSYEWERKGRWW